jgi:BirA family biotin operon repressor/biotin-[acetyl-CoA-carboxylase] ligase
MKHSTGIAAQPNWMITRLEEVDSTNDYARLLKPWEAVAARAQTAGRGRHGRTWHSAHGGLWFSAVFPAPKGRDTSELTAFSLCMALAIVEWLASRGVEARVRWPNDILIGDRKLAGLLVELLLPDRIIVGVGMNVGNDLALLPPDIETPATRLADHNITLPDTTIMLVEMLETMTRAWHQFARTGFTQAREALNERWHAGRFVELEMEGGVCAGRFVGVNEQGWPVLRLEDGGWCVVRGPDVRRLREI